MSQTTVLICYISKRANIPQTYTEGETVKLKGGKIMGNIEVSSISKVYKTQDDEKAALSAVSIVVPQGELFCIMGSSGSGKSTLLKILGGMERFTSGEISIDGKQMSKFMPQDYDLYRQNMIGFVFQDFNLLDGLTLKENIILPLTLQKLSFSEIEKRYQTVTQYIDIADCQNNYPEKSSGGEQQRAAICRALIKSPILLLADEPTGSLDNPNTKAVLEVLTKINKSLNTTIVLVTHDAVVASYCNTVVFLENGKVYNTLYKTGTTQSFYNLIVVESSKVRGIL
jgi:ABC-type lipoprotein export system ATPase subunit